MKHVNSFNLMNSDVARIYQRDKEYIRAKNMRPVTSTGGTTGSLTTIMGNTCAVTFPTLRSVYKLAIVEFNSGGSWVNGSVFISVGIHTTASIPITPTTTPSNIVAYLKQLPNHYSGTYSASRTFTTAYDSEYVYIFQQPEYTGCSSDASVNPEIAISIGTSESYVAYVKPDGTTTTTNTPYIPSQSETPIVIGSTYINDKSYLFTCGSTNSDGLGQIWELSQTETSSHGTPVTVNNLKLLYNNYLNFSVDHPIPPTATVGRYEVPSIQRIYWSDNYNSVRSANIADTNLMGKSPEEFNLRPSAYLNIPTLKSICDGCAPDEGGLRTDATYQLAYRLIDFNGGMTNYSPLSNIVQVIDTDKSYQTYQSTAAGGTGNFASITGDSVPSTELTGDNEGELIDRTITWRVDGIDTNYETIEYVVAIRQYPEEDGFHVYKFAEELIGGTEEHFIRFDGDPTNMEEIPLTEFLIDNVSFTHCKSLETKDNRLFYANTKNDLGEYLENFDTRVFRFASGSFNTKVKAREATNTTITYTVNGTTTNYSDIPETNDNIPVYNLDVITNNNDTLYDGNYKYQRGSTDIGGTGENISFTFGAKLLHADGKISSGNWLPNENTNDDGDTQQGTNFDDSFGGGDDNNVQGFRVPMSQTSLEDQHHANGDPSDRSFEPGAPNQSYNGNGYAETMALEYFSSNFRSYQHNEIYRFAIVFTGKQSGKYFAKWIGDIKFPHYSDTIPSGKVGKTLLGNSPTVFQSLYIDNSGAYLVVPYIEFSVTITPELANLISGYEIVRVQRTAEDCSIVDHGVITQIAKDGGNTTNRYLPLGCELHAYGPIYFCDPYQTSTNTAGDEFRGELNALAFHSFKTAVDKNTDSFSATDELVICEKYKAVALHAVDATVTGPPGLTTFKHRISPDTVIATMANRFQIAKLYSRQASYNASKIGIAAAHYVSQGGTTDTLTVTGGVYVNRDFEDTSNLDKAQAVGSPCVILELDEEFDFTNFNSGGSNVESNPGSLDGNSKLLAVHYRFSKLKNQYGGRTFQARQENEYISTGGYYTVREAGTATLKVFGGDVYHDIIDIQKAIKNYTSFTPATTGQLFSQSWFLPAQSRYNLALRVGDHINSGLNTDVAPLSVNFLAGANAIDEYYYNSYNNYENTLHKFVAKPVLFNETSTNINRVYWSSIKINGDTIDGWTSIGSEDYYDVDGNHGGINAIITLNDSLYAIQDNAVNRLLVNPYAVVQSQDSVDLTLSAVGNDTDLSSGSILTKHTILGTDIGSVHQWSVCRSPNHITFVDARRRKAYLFDGQQFIPISDIKGQRGFFNKILHNKLLTTDNPIIEKGILTAYDPHNSEFLYTLLNIDTVDGQGLITGEKYTIAYNLFADGFTSMYDFTPYIYINNTSRLYSLNVDNDTSDYAESIYIHNTEGTHANFYGTQYPSSVKFVVNANPLNTKVFDNISWYTEVSNTGLPYMDDITDYGGDTSNKVPLITNTFTKIRCYNEYQNSDWVTVDDTPITGNIRKVEQGFNMHVPRNKVDYDNNAVDTYSIFDSNVLTKTEFGERMRDKYMVVDLEYEGSDRLVLHNVTTSYRMSDR